MEQARIDREAGYRLLGELAGQATGPAQDDGPGREHTGNGPEGARR